MLHSHLNSIMILLIHNSENPNYIELVNLNSIMILLIRVILAFAGGETS